MGFDPLDDLLGRSARSEDRSDPSLSEVGNVLFRNDSPAEVQRHASGIKRGEIPQNKMCAPGKEKAVKGPGRGL